MSKNTALLIVDVQAFLVEHAFQGHALAERIKTLGTRARELQIPIIYIQHCENEGEFEIGTPTWEIHHTISPNEGEPVIRKYSCDSFLDTSLKEELDAREINHLVIVGMQTEYCIDTTSRRAISLGYQVTLVGDCHSTLNNRVLKAEQIIDHHNTVLHGFGTATNGIVVKSSDTLFI
ncbi:isochorismatase [Brevibacillus reuszeri]|uniref:Isochorismatase n=1 Tax=Brevibacillus reuszeri TaxID=54915 RepID=A0A0K9YNP2_9BACL|nr:cysteine hydrolase family protein [Brevibacillus reuszeri]KNB70296.1 isochorismatase [Brevibacillus reuszeri]MED1859259.1 cysteine hydrolase family protein [Brevibacillus reuszeri]GED72245.1 isochorismatase [Brevibacillus reuszeri]